MNQNATYYGVGVESFNQRSIDILEWACILRFRNISIFPAVTLFLHEARARATETVSNRENVSFYVLIVHINSLGARTRSRFRIQYKLQ